MRCHVRREESGSRAPGVPGCPSVLKAWFWFCSALKFTKQGLQDEPAGICGICFAVPSVALSRSQEQRAEETPRCTAVFWEGSANRARLCESELGLVLPPDMAFLCHCPTWSANACCLPRAPSLSFRGSLRDAEPCSSSVLTCRVNARALVGGA